MIQVSGGTQTILGDSPIGFGLASVDVSAGTTVIVEPEDAACMIVRLYGALPNNTVAELPLKEGGRWIIVNDTTGNKTLTIMGETGTGVVVGQGKRLHVHCNGTNFYASNTDAPAMGAMPSGRLSKAVGGSSDVTLTLAEAAFGIIELTGTLTATIFLIFPILDGRQWTIHNKTVLAGDEELHLKTVGGSTVTILPQLGRQIFYCDGAELIAATDFFIP